MRIAIIGAACRVPGADTLPDLWRLLVNRTTVTGPVPAGRFSGPVGDPSTADGANYGGFLPSVHDFDHEFFSISAAEAADMDPQQRLFLEVAWHCLDHAAVPASRLAGSATGVYVGQSTFDHAMAVARRGPHELGPYTNTGLSHAVTANRLSYLWDLRGPSLTVDTACSSSLTAVHLAVRALRAGDCDLALAGGVNVLTSAVPHVGAARLTALSTDGQCRAFDRSANGYVRAEGAAAVLLKRVEDARRDGDRVLAVIRGTAVNQDGRTNGLTAPSGRAQTAVVNAALADAELTVDDIDYVEAHGTGTPLGDPIEARALGVAFTGRRRPLHVGSVKANLGHLESAAGITGLLKAVLMLEHRTAPGIANLRTVNPLIDPDRFNLRLSAESIPWPHQDPIATVAVSSFGFGGTNAHVIISTDDVRPAQDPGVDEGAGEGAGQDAGWRWLPISGRTPTAVRTLAARYGQLLSTADPAVRTGIIQAAAHRRSHHEIRAAAVGRGWDELVAAVQAIAMEGPPPVRVTTDRRIRVVFVFSGHGSQWVGMGRDLLASEPRFAEVARRCDAAFATHLGWSVIDAFTGTVDEDDVAVIQPLIFTVQVALAAALHARGVIPDAVVGHSVGEIAAAVVAGQLHLDAAARVIVTRNEAVRSVRGTGGMLVVDLPAREAETFLRLDPAAGTVTVAASNSPRSTVLSGTTDDMNRVADRLRAAGHDARPIKVDYPSHSPAMAGPADRLGRALGPVEHQTGAADFYSSVTGASAGTQPLPADYWAQNLIARVDFSAAVAAAVADGATHLIELSPHPVLLPAIRECVADQQDRVAALFTLHRDDPAGYGVGTILARLYEAGWTPRASPCPAPTVPLPGYPFEPTPVPAPRGESPGDVAFDPRRSGELTSLGWLPDVRCCDVPTTLFGPGHRAGEIQIAAAHGLASGLRQLARDSGIDDDVVTSLRIARPLPLGVDTTARVTLLTPAGTAPTITVAVREGTTWVVAATARLLPRRPHQPAVAPSNLRGQVPPGIDHQNRLRELGAGLGVGAGWLTGLTVDPAGAACGRIDPARGGADHRELVVGLGNAAMLVMAAALLARDPLPAGVRWMVTGIDEFVLPDDQPSTSLHVTAAMTRIDPTGAVGAVTGRDPSGRVVLLMSGVTLVPVADDIGTDGEPGDLNGTTTLSLPTSPSQRRRALQVEVGRQLTQVIPRLPHRGRIDDRPFKDLGLDSLTAVELRNRLERSLGLRLSVALLWANPTPSALVDALVPLTGPGHASEPIEPSTPATGHQEQAPDGVEHDGPVVLALLAELAAEIDAAGFDASVTESLRGDAR